MMAMAEIDAKHIGTLEVERFDLARGLGGGAQGGDYLGITSASHGRMLTFASGERQPSLP